MHTQTNFSKLSPSAKRAKIANSHTQEEDCKEVKVDIKKFRRVIHVLFVRIEEIITVDMDPRHPLTHVWIKVWGKIRITKE